MLPESEADVSQNLEPASDASVAAQSGLLACSSSDSSGSGARLLAIRSDEARVWSSWLTKVAERVDDEWQEWLAAHINLTRRLNACLLGARDECRKRERTQLLRQAQPEEPPDLPCDYTADLEMGPCKVSRSTTTGILRDACSDKAGTASERGRSRATHLGNADDSFNNDVAAENEEEWEDEEEEDGRVADECGENKAVHEARTRTLTNEREADDGGADESCSESDGQRQEQGGCSQSSTSGSVFSSEPSNDERLGEGKDDAAAVGRGSGVRGAFVAGEQRPRLACGAYTDIQQETRKIVMSVVKASQVATNASFAVAFDDITTVATALALGILILVTIIGNVFVIAAIKMERNLQSVANYLIMSLAFADLMVACLVMPLGAVYEINSGWSLGPKWCDVWTICDVLCCTASILHLVAIAVDRYWAVTDLNYIQSRNPWRIGGLIVAVWSISLCVSFAPQLGWKDPGYMDRIEEGKCLVSQDPAYQIFATCATFYLPLLVILFLYWRIFQAARRRIRKRPGTTIQPPRERRGILRLIRRSPREESTAFTITRSTPDHSSVSPEKSSSHNGANPVQACVSASGATTIATTAVATAAAAPGTTTASSTRKSRETIEAKRERKAAKTLAIITGAFVACWLPFFLVALLQAVCAPWEPPALVASVFLWLGYFNSTLNPVIYTVFSPEFRQAFKRILGIGPPRPGR